MDLSKNENTIAFIIVMSVLILVSMLWFAFENPNLNPRLEKENYTIMKKWELPKQLNEVSGISWISENKLACIQDEDGIIFIYNLQSSRVEKEIEFGKDGDYEAIAIVDSTAYVMRSDGHIFEVTNYLRDNFSIKEHTTPFDGKNNMEALTFDKKNNRLLLAAKNKDLHNDDYKAIYSFNLKTKKLNPKPLLRFPYNDPIFKKNDADDDDPKGKSFYPSDLAINPINGNIYILEGKNPQLLIIKNDGKTVQLNKLLKESFPQPEGIIFSPDGTLYISNEGKKGNATILEVELLE